MSCGIGTLHTWRPWLSAVENHRGIGVLLKQEHKLQTQAEPTGLLRGAQLKIQIKTRAATKERIIQPRAQAQLPWRGSLASSEAPAHSPKSTRPAEHACSECTSRGFWGRKCYCISTQKSHWVTRGPGLPSQEGVVVRDPEEPGSNPPRL